MAEAEKKEERNPEVQYPGVEVVDAQGDSALVGGFSDHFTLSIPSSTVRYRDSRSAARVIDGQDFQFVLEETYDKDTHKHEVSIRRIQDSSEGVVFLRILYTIVTAFWTGFLFVFCLQVLLFLLLDLAIEIGLTDRQEAAWGSSFGVILSIVPLVYGLASAMVLGGAYIQDTWHGHPLIKNFTFRNLSTVTGTCFFTGKRLLSGLSLYSIPPFLTMFYCYSHQSSGSFSSSSWVHLSRLWVFLSSFVQTSGGRRPVLFGFAAYYCSLSPSAPTLFSTRCAPVG